MIRTQTYTAKLSKSTHQKLDDFLYNQTCLYNMALRDRKDIYEETGKGISFQDQCKKLTQLRGEYDDVDQYSSICQRTALSRLDKAFKRFFKNVQQGNKPGYPRLKSEDRGIRSFETSTFSKIRTEGKFNTISFKGIGKFRFKGDVPEKIKMVRVVKTPLRVKIQLIFEQEIQITPDDRPIVGIDVGITNNITLSSGHQLPKRKLNRLKIKKLQRKVSRSKKKSNNQIKKRKALQREWQRQTEREKNFTHQITSEIIKHFSSNLAVENLNIQNMVKNKYLARPILEQHWGYFIQLLTYKAEKAGGQVVKVNPRNTSKKCSSCGHINTELTLEDRMYECIECGHTQDRDVNASINIGSLGISESGGNKVLMTPEICSDIVFSDSSGETLFH